MGEAHTQPTWPIPIQVAPDSKHGSQQHRHAQLSMKTRFFWNGTTTPFSSSLGAVTSCNEIKLRKTYARAACVLDLKLEQRPLLRLLLYH